MLQLFRNGQPLTAIFVGLYALLVLLHLFLVPDTSTYSTPNGILSELLFYYLSPQSLSAKITTVFLIIIQALLVNYLANRFKVLASRTFLPALAYVLLMGFLHDEGGLTSVLLANTFFLIAVIEMLKIYRVHKCAEQIFNVGFWIAVGSLFYFSSGLLLIWGIIGLFLLRSSSLNDLLIFLIGFFVPYLLIGTSYFFLDKFPEFLSVQFADNFSLRAWLVKKESWMYIKPGIILLMSLGFVGAFGRILARISTQSQKFFSLFYWFLLISGLTLMIQKGLDINHAVLAAIPMSVLLASLWLKTKNNTAIELVHLVLLIAVLAYQYQSLL